MPILRHIFLLLGGVVVVGTSCVKDKPEVQSNTTVQLSTVKKVLVINEGNFTSGNASLSLYDPGTGDVIADIYKTQNSALLGDVAQSVSHINDKFYIIVNNSGKIVICDQHYKKQGEISGLNSPRYLVQVSNQKGYVSDYSANSIHIVDLNTFIKTGSIACKGWTEQMTSIYNKVFVCNVKRNYVYVINTLNDKIEDSVLVGVAASSMVLDKNDKLWVLASGTTTNQAAQLSRINTINNVVEQVYTFPTDAVPEKLCLNKGKDTLYFLNGDIYCMPLTQSALPMVPLISKGTKVFYGLGINPNDYHIYAADALDYVQKSQIYIYDNKGKPLSNFKAGIISNGFYFE